MNGGRLRFLLAAMECGDEIKKKVWVDWCARESLSLYLEFEGDES